LSLLLLFSLLVNGGAIAQEPLKKFDQEDKFRQLEELLPTPTDYRTASGAPGKDYWQQQVDYEIDVEIDDENQRLIGSERITYTNRSPDPLKYIWLQLDPNIRQSHSDANLSRTNNSLERLSYRGLQRMIEAKNFDGGIKIAKVADTKSGDKLPFTIVKTMMRVDIPEPISSGQSYTFQVDWSYAINNSKKVGGRTGCEFFEKDGNYIYELAQWYPRAAAYTDVTGWQHKQFLGSGEFTLDFGKFIVRITVPDDHIVASTGELQNAADVLTDSQRDRLQDARDSSSPMFVVEPDEAKENEASKPGGKKTWVFEADRVRDFAFATSRKFIWDAMGYKTSDGRTVMCMSYYPNEGEPLWSRYSTHAVAHTLDVYGKFTFEYPYPVAISVNGPVGGMEYPMICFNGPRPEEDGTYSARSKYGLISVVIHEVGHNWFPMIVNSDERQWTWMDEGLNTFMQKLAEREWEEKYPSRRGNPRSIVGFMTSQNQVPIMTNSESLLQFGNNAYAKPAAALSVLRETVVGRELFDFAFKEYSTRWMFKRPMPADFFRTMEDASAIDLDWFWRGWFYSTDHVDVSIAGLKRVTLNTNNDYTEKPKKQQIRDSAPAELGEVRNSEVPKRVDKFPELQDFYNEYDELEITEADREAYETFMADLSDEHKELLDSQVMLYSLELNNVGGLVTPVIVEIEYQDGEKEVRRFPAEIWRKNNRKITKLLITEKPIKQVTLDPNWETADADVSNNYFPPRIEDTNVPVSNFDPRRGTTGERRKNPMQKARDWAKKKAKDAEGKSDEGDSSKQNKESPKR